MFHLRCSVVCGVCLDKARGACCRSGLEHGLNIKFGFTWGNQIKVPSGSHFVKRGVKNSLKFILFVVF